MKRRRSSRSPTMVLSPISIRRCLSWRPNLASCGARRTTIMALTIKKIGVIGAGQMGNGIAHVAALAGFDVLLNDVSGDRIKAGLATVNGNLARQASRQRITEDERKAALSHIAAADTL